MPSQQYTVLRRDVTVLSAVVCNLTNVYNANLLSISSVADCATLKLSTVECVLIHMLKVRANTHYSNVYSMNWSAIYYTHIHKPQEQPPPPWHRSHLHSRALLPACLQVHSIEHSIRALHCTNMKTILTHLTFCEHAQRPDLR
jgi:hypothetical protein